MPRRELLHYLFALSPWLQGYTNSVYVRRGLIGVGFTGIDHKTVEFMRVVFDHYLRSYSYYLNVLSTIISSTIIIPEIAKG